MSLWTVEEHAWKQDLPDLPDDVIALLADPVVVCAQREPADELRTEPDTVPV
jgi:hypothetical protein